MIWPMLLLPLE